MRWLRKLVKQAVLPDQEIQQSGLNQFEKIDENLTPNLRALRLTMTMADYLLSMGVAVSDVVGMSLDVTETYCKRKVQVDINSTVMMFSQDRGNDREPLTLVRHISQYTVNNLLVQSLQELIEDIKENKVSLTDAENRLHDLLNDKNEYPLWLTTLGSASISAGVGALLTGSFIIIAIMFVVAAAVSYIIRLMSERKIPMFFSQVVAAAIITLVAGGVSAYAQSSNLPWFDDVNPSLIVIGGIIMLVAGLAIVGAVQDAIDEFYVTANARLLKVFMMTIGIVAGVMIGLYLSNRLGLPLHIDTERPPLEVISWQYVGAIAIAAGYTLSTQTKWTGVLLAGLLGALSWYIFVSTSLTISIIAASGAAATVVGVIATLISRSWRIPSNALITAGIIPLVPGLTLFNGLLEIVQNTESMYSLTGGLITLFNAIMIALAIAAGATFGNLVARPLDRTLVKARNSLPQRVRPPKISVVKNRS